MRAALTALLLAAAAGAQELPARGPYLIDASSVSWRACWAFAREPECAGATGLAPGSTFTYRVPGTTVAVAARLLPPAGAPVRFAVLGDMGHGGAAQRAVAAQVELSTPQFVVALGDIVYPRGEDADYDAKYFSVYARLLPRVPFFTILGNHDYGDRPGRAAGLRHVAEYRRIHGRPPYYSFDAGPVHFAAIDDNGAAGIGAAEPYQPRSPQWRWLDADLRRATARWKIVLLHVPMYLSFEHGDQEALRKALEPVLRRHEVDLVFQGHGHIYERSQRIGGVVYVTAGTGGAPLRPGRRRDWLDSQHKAFGFVEVDADARRLALRFIDAAGKVLDQAELKK